MRIKYSFVSSLGEYVDCMGKIAGEDTQDLHCPPVLWYRGLGNVNYSLIPSLFRTNAREQGVKSTPENYSALHYAEDIRTQHYIAKNYHFLSKEPSSRVEWLEVMQHHGVKTRVMDWSESSIHSLLFALEPFVDESRYDIQSRQDSIPCVWVLNPQKLNRKIFEILRKDLELVKELLKELDFTDAETKELTERIKNGEQFEKNRDTRHMDYILNLSSINDEILRDRSRLKFLLTHGEVINPYYYLLGRVYSDGVILKKRGLPPLAVVHPYHSDRIRAQKGVFTVFPYYKEQEKDGSLRTVGINPDAMENNLLAGDCLHKVIIEAPQKMAYELLSNGMNASWLYPEMPIVSNEIENRHICI